MLIDRLDMSYCHSSGMSVAVNEAVLMSKMSGSSFGFMDVAGLFETILG